MQLPSQKSIAVLMFCGLLGGCTTMGEKYQRPAVAVPAGWQDAAGNPAAWPDREWWQGFHTAELDRLIAEAQNNNHNLKAAAARVAQAHAAAKIAGAPLFPTVAVEANAGRSRTRATDTAGATTVTSATSYSFLPQASYEIDVWGANRLAGEAADDAVLSSAYGQEVVRLTLTSDVAAAYFLILSLNDRLDVARRNLAIAVRLQELVDAQKRAGRLSPFEVERQRTLVSTAEAAIPPLLLQLRTAHDALAVLLGKNPGEVAISARSMRSLAVPEVPIGLPSQLLERRPDIRQAEMNLIAANADMGAARAALFPTFGLTAQAGATKTVISSLLSSATNVQSISLSVLATIFDGGRLGGQADLATARNVELAETYQQSVVSGFRDVEDALAGIQHFTAQEKAQREALDHAREVYRIADRLMRSGATDFTAVLDAERTLLSVETAADEARLNLFNSVIGLYRALGGGWDTQTPQAAAPQGDGVSP